METYKGYGIEIEQDENPESPRTWDNLGVMVCKHKRYDLPCEVPVPWEELESWEEVKQYLITEHTPVLILPLFAYDHGSFSIALAPHGQHYQWDGGQIGFVMVTQENIDNMGITKPTPEELITELTKQVGAEIEEYTQYLEGDVWGYRIYPDYDPEGVGDDIDSCWGYFGYDYCLEDAKRTVDAIIKVKESKAWEYVNAMPNEM